MPAKTDFSAQPDHSSLGYRGKLGLRGAGANGFRATRASENVNPNFGVGSKMSPRLGTNSGRSLLTMASSRQQHAGAFGTDITNNITNIAGKVDTKFKAVKQVPLTQQAEPSLAAASPSVVETPSSETKAEPENLQEVEQYVSDIDSKLFSEEAAFLPRPDYMEMQTDLTPKMRTILVDWLIEVHMKYRLHSETLHLAVNLIDRHLTRTTVARKKLQLVGVVAMFIASKFEEINPPELHDWVYITDKAYSKEDVLVTECSMLTTLSFQIMVPTAAHFFPALAKANGCNNVHSQLAQYIIELGLLDIKMLHYTPSHAVSAALLLSNELLGRSPVWPQSMVQRSRHTDTALRSCVELLRQLYDTDKTAAGAQLQAVHKKFSQKDHQSVATMRF